MWRHQGLTQQLPVPRQGTGAVWCLAEESLMKGEGLEFLTVSFASSFWPMASLVADPTGHYDWRIAREAPEG